MSQDPVAPIGDTAAAPVQADVPASDQRGTWRSRLTLGAVALTAAGSLWLALNALSPGPGKHVGTEGAVLVDNRSPHTLLLLQQKLGYDIVFDRGTVPPNEAWILVPAVEFAKGGLFADRGCTPWTGLLVAYDETTHEEVAEHPASMCRGETWTISAAQATSAP